MYIRDAKNREEVWLLDRLEEFGFEDPAFRSRDYVLAIDEDAGEKVGFGRIRVHPVSDGEVCELACIGALPEHRGEGIGAHIIERLVENARDQGFDTVYAFTSVVEYCEQFGFGPVDTDALPEKLVDRLETVRERDPDTRPVRIAVADFEMPPRLRRRFHDETPDEEESSASERPEDFGIDPDTASYKYDTGRE